MPDALYQGPADGRLIADGTDPWIVVDRAPVDWENRSPLPAVLSDCETCSGSPLRGVIAPMNTAVGVQRCDECGLFEGDLVAAEALAGLVGGRVWFETP